MAQAPYRVGDHRIDANFMHLYEALKTYIHNTLPDLQGGGPNAYYHIDAALFNTLVDAQAQWGQLHKDGSPEFVKVKLTGIPGLEVVDSTLIANLNADLHDGWHLLYDNDYGCYFLTSA